MTRTVKWKWAYLVGIITVLAGIQSLYKGCFDKPDKPSGNSILHVTNQQNTTINNNAKNIFGGSVVNTATQQQSIQQIQNKGAVINPKQGSVIEKSKERKNVTDIQVENSSPIENPEQATNLLVSLMGTIHIDTSDLKQIRDCIKKGANVNAVNSTSGLSALHFAALYNDTMLANMIVHNPNANVCIRDSIRNATPLWYASNMNNYSIVDSILHHGGDKKIDIRELHGQSFAWKHSTALDSAKDKNMKNLLRLYGAHTNEEIEKMKK